MVGCMVYQCQCTMQHLLVIRLWLSREIGIRQTGIGEWGIGETGFGKKGCNLLAMNVLFYNYFSALKCHSLPLISYLTSFSFSEFTIHSSSTTASPVSVARARKQRQEGRGGTSRRHGELIKLWSWFQHCLLHTVCTSSCNIFHLSIFQNVKDYHEGTHKVNQFNSGQWAVEGMKITWRSCCPCPHWLYSCLSVSLAVSQFNCVPWQLSLSDLAWNWARFYSKQARSWKRSHSQVQFYLHVWSVTLLFLVNFYGIID